MDSIQFLHFSACAVEVFLLQKFLFIVNIQGSFCILELLLQVLLLRFLSFLKHCVKSVDVIRNCDCNCVSVKGSEGRTVEMPAGWRVAGSMYKLQYTHPLCENSLAVVVSIPMGSMLVINGESTNLGLDYSYPRTVSVPLLLFSYEIFCR